VLIRRYVKRLNHCADDADDDDDDIIQSVRTSGVLSVVCHLSLSIYSALQSK